MERRRAGRAAARWLKLTLCNRLRSGSTLRSISSRLSERLFADGDGGSIAELREQLRFLTEERDRLLRDLDAERRAACGGSRPPTSEVSGRLEAVMVTLKDMMPAVPG